jgi:hypothetical protein
MPVENQRRNMTSYEKLSSILNKTFPRTRDTGKASDLSTIKSDPKNEQAVLFTYKKIPLRMTDNFRVQEIDFTNSIVESPFSKEVEEQIAKTLHDSIPQELPTESPTPTPNTEVPSANQTIIEPTVENTELKCEPTSNTEVPPPANPPIIETTKENTEPKSELPNKNIETEIA